ncbi:MAG TPA: dihydrofolate reductase family protein [Kofleriaceae bacterium]|nr:dihydrofolate reductase family protein [Kofleriaceae bacterium]
MRCVSVFQQVSADGYFVTRDGDSSWTHAGPHDPALDAFVQDNARDESVLVFGRKTYELMASFWPTPLAAQQMPEVAARMNELPKLVFSTSLTEARWQNTELVAEDPVATIRARKREPGPPLTIMGSGTIIAQLARAGLLDEVQLLVIPIVLGSGRSMFDGSSLALTLVEHRTFEASGRVFTRYSCAKAN